MPFWREFLASLKQRGLTCVRLVCRMVQGCSRQRCRLHFAHNILQTVPRAQQEMDAAVLRSVFSQQRTAAVEGQGHQVGTMLTGKFHRAAELTAEGRR